MDKSKHIVFDSDDDEEEDKTTSRPGKPPTNLKKSLFEDDSGSDEDQQTSMSKEKANMGQVWKLEVYFLEFFDLFFMFPL